MVPLILLLSTFLAASDGARILGVFPTPSYSHQIIFQPIWRELALRGHDVVILTTDPINDPSIPNLREISWKPAYNIWEKKINAVIEENLLNMILSIMDLMNEVMEYELGLPEVQTILKNETEHFDLVMVEYLMPIMSAFKHRFNCPMIGITSLEAPKIVHDALGNPTHSVVYPENFLQVDSEMGFFERLISVGFVHFMDNLGKIHIVPQQDELVTKYFGSGYPKLLELYKSVDMIFMNTNPVFNNVRPLTPSTITIGGGIHIKKLKPLPEDLKKFMDDAKEGVIYMSLGSNVKSKDIPMRTRNILLEVFREMPYKVLWKFEAEELPGKPDNVKIMKWVPQQDVLRHPNILVFITQGGLQSLEEALFTYTPIVGLPFFADQNANAMKIEKKGLGLILDHNVMVASELKATILEVINNPKYKLKTKELADLVRDEPMNALEKAVWWTEYVLRHKGAKHLQNPIKIPFYQFYYLDIISALLIIVTSCVYLTYIFTKKIISCAANLFFRRKHKTD